MLMLIIIGEEEGYFTMMPPLRAEHTIAFTIIAGVIFLSSLSLVLHLSHYFTSSLPFRLLFFAIIYCHYHYLLHAAIITDAISFLHAIILSLITSFFFFSMLMLMMPFSPFDC